MDEDKALTEKKQNFEEGINIIFFFFFFVVVFSWGGHNEAREPLEALDTKLRVKLITVINGN